MAVAPNDIPIHRRDVHGWIDAYNAKHPPNQTLEDYIRKEVNKLNLPDVMVNTTSNESLPDETHIADMIVMDLPSYATSN